MAQNSYGPPQTDGGCILARDRQRAEAAARPEERIDPRAVCTGGTGRMGAYALRWGMYVCKCVCVYVNQHFYTYMCTCMHTGVCRCVYIYIDICIHFAWIWGRFGPQYVCICIYVHVYIYTCMYVCMYMVNIYICIYVYMYLYMCA